MCRVFLLGDRRGQERHAAEPLKRAADSGYHGARASEVATTLQAIQLTKDDGEKPIERVALEKSCSSIGAASACCRIEAVSPGAYWSERCAC